MKIYSIVLVDKYKEECILAHTTTKEKAEEIIEILKEDNKKQGLEDFVLEYKIRWIKLDTVYIDGKEVEV